MTYLKKLDKVKKIPLDQRIHLIQCINKYPKVMDPDHYLDQDIIIHIDHDFNIIDLGDDQKTWGWFIKDADKKTPAYYICVSLSDLINWI